MASLRSMSPRRTRTQALGLRLDKSASLPLTLQEASLGVLHCLPKLPLPITQITLE